MNCNKCGKQIPDDSVFCPSCGTPCEAAPAQVPHPISQPVETVQPIAAEPAAAGEPPLEAKKRSGGRGILLGLGCLLLAAVIGFGAWFLLRKNSPEAKLLQAAKNSVSDLGDYLKELPNLRTVMEHLDAIDLENALHADVNVDASAQADYGDATFVSSTKLSASFDWDRTAKKALGSLLYQTDSAFDEETQTLSLPLTVYADEAELRMTSAAALEEGEYLSLPIQDLPAQWNASAFSELTGITLPDDLELNARPEQDDLEQMLLDRYGEDWKQFSKSVQVRKYDGASPFGAEGTTYALVWDRALLKKMADEADTTDDSPSLDILTGSGGRSAEQVILFLNEINGMLSDDPLFYVENDRLTGLWLSNANAGEALTLRLLGGQNPWEHLTLTVQPTGASDRAASTEVLDVTTSKTADVLRIDAVHKYVKADGSEEQSLPAAIVYNDNDGSFHFLTDDEPEEEMPTVTLTPTDDGARLYVQILDDRDLDEDASYENHSAAEVSLVLSGKAAPITAPGNKPIELLKLSEEELEALFTRIGEKLEPMFGSTFE